VVVRYRKKPGYQRRWSARRSREGGGLPGSPLIGRLDRRLRQRGGAGPAYIVEVTGQSEIEVVQLGCALNRVSQTLSRDPMGLAATPLAGSGAVGTTVATRLPELFVTAHADGPTGRSCQEYVNELRNLLTAHPLPDTSNQEDEILRPV
jgi:hypothetical protein